MVFRPFLVKIWSEIGRDLRHFWARLLTVLGRVCFETTDLAHCLCPEGCCGGVFAGKGCALKSDLAHDVRRPCPKPSQTLPNGSEQGTEGAASMGSRDDPRSPADLDGQAGGFELDEAAGLVLFCGGREGERFRVEGGAQALVLAFADVVVGKEIHFVGLAV